jgi:hypothetical protein
MRESVKSDQELPVGSDPNQWVTRTKIQGFIAGLVPAISVGMAGTSPAVTKRERPRVLPLLLQ